MQIDFHYHARRAHSKRGRLRAEALQQLQQGKSIRETAAMFQQSRASIHRWLKWLEKPNGLEQLVGPVKGRGRRPKSQKKATTLDHSQPNGIATQIDQSSSRPLSNTTSMPDTYDPQHTTHPLPSAIKEDTIPEVSRERSGFFGNALSGINGLLKRIGFR